MTGAWLSGRRRVPRPAARRSLAGRPLVGVRGARANNLAGVDLLVPLGALTVLTGVSGSGKSTLAHDVMYLALRRALGKPEGTPGAHDDVVGVERLSDVVLVDQSSVGRTPRANAATYVGAWDAIRALYAKTPEAKAAGWTASTFSFNVPGGRCERCKGDGHEKVEMQFLSDVYVPCPDCAGKRFRPEIAELKREGLSIVDVLGLTVDDALERFAAHPKVTGALRPLADVGLGYLRLGQPATDAVGRRGAADQAGDGASARAARGQLVRARRADDGPPPRGRVRAAQGPRAARRAGPRRAGRRAPPRRDGGGRPRDRSRARGRPRGRARGRARHPRGGRARRRAHGAAPAGGARRAG